MSQGIADMPQGEVSSARLLPLHGALSALVPQGGLRGGTVVACGGVAAVSLALAVASAPSIAGSWVAVVGLPTLGLAAAAEAGVVLDRLVRVAAPPDVSTRRADGVWADLLAASVDGFDLVIIGEEAGGVSPSTVRRLVARAAQRGTVFIAIDAPVFGADVRLEITGSAWRGLGEGYGIALGRQADVQASGRRLPGTRRTRLWLPAADGAVAGIRSDAQSDTQPDHGAPVPLRSAG